MLDNRQIPLTKEPPPELPRKINYSAWENAADITGKPSVSRLPQCPYEVDIDQKAGVVRIYYSP